MPSRIGHRLYKKIDSLKNIFRCIYITIAQNIMAYKLLYCSYTFIHIYMYIQGPAVTCACSYDTIINIMIDGGDNSYFEPV